MEDFSMKKVLIVITAVAIMITAIPTSTANEPFGINDAMEILKHIAGISVLTDVQAFEYDLNNDGKVDIDDAMVILKGLAGIIEMPERPTKNDDSQQSESTVTTTEIVTQSQTIVETDETTPAIDNTTPATTTLSTPATTTTPVTATTTPVESTPITTAAPDEITSFETTNMSITFDTSSQSEATTTPDTTTIGTNTGTGTSVSVSTSTATSVSTSTGTNTGTSTSDSTNPNPPPYTIIFEPNFDNAPMPTLNNTDENGRISGWSSPWRTGGYRFIAWFTEPAGGQRILTGSNGHVFTDHTTVYAQWAHPGAHIITLFANGGTNSTTGWLSVDREGKFTETLPVPTRLNHTFDGWFTTSGTQARFPGVRVTNDSVFNGSTIIFARWTPVPITYNITLDANGGAFLDERGGGTTATVFPGADGRLIVAQTPRPTRPGFAFGGWRTHPTETGSNTWISVGSTGTQFDKATTIYATWSPIGVTFSGNGGRINDSTSLVVPLENSSSIAALPTATREGAFEFVGWFTERNGGERVTTQTVFDSSANPTVHAQWRALRTAQSFAVSLNSNLSEPSIPILPHIFTDANGRLSELLPNLERTGFVFGGWWTAPTGGTRVSSGTAGNVFTTDTTIHARWTPITVTFNVDGGTGTPAVATVNSQGRLTSLPAAPTRSGFNFVGWYTSRTGGSPADLDTVYTRNATLWARWESSNPALRTITLNTGMNGNVPVSTILTGADGRIANLADPTDWNSAFFNGWYLMRDNGWSRVSERITGGVNGTVFNEDMMITADWSFSPAME
jgi:uncharacterized repeat protein (TIGR02543 family)